MATGPERRVSPMAQRARSIAGFSLVLLIVAGVGHRYGMVETVAYFWILALVAGLALLALGLAAGGFWRLWLYGEKAGKASLAATLLAAIVLAPYAAGAYFVLRYPVLNDISTDLVEPPQFVLAPARRSGAMNAIVPFTREAAALQTEHYPDVSGRRYDASMSRVMNAAAAVIASRGWKPYARLPLEAEHGEVSIELEAPTLLVRFPADAVLRLTDEGASTFVDMRLNTRYAKHDLGDNARRIRAFMSDLDAEFARQSLEIIDIPASDEEEDPVD